MPARDPDKPAGYYCDGTRHKADCPDKAACSGCLPPCSMRAGWGTDHPGTGNGPCKRHGGATRNHKRAAEMNMAAIAASKLDLSLTTDPVSALLDELNRRFRWVAFLESLVMELPTHPEDDVFVPPSEEAEGAGGDDHKDAERSAGYWVRGKPGLYGRVYAISGIPTGEAKPHVLVELYERERQQLVRVASECVKANVSQRSIELAEGHARQVAAVFTAFVLGLGLDPMDPKVKAAGRAALLKVGGVVVEGSVTELGA